MACKLSAYFTKRFYSKQCTLQLGFCRLRVQGMISRSGVKLCSDLCDGEFVVIFDL